MTIGQNPQEVLGFSRAQPVPSPSVRESSEGEDEGQFLCAARSANVTYFFHLPSSPRTMWMSRPGIANSTICHLSSVRFAT